LICPLTLTAVCPETINGKAQKSGNNGTREGWWPLAGLVPEDDARAGAHGERRELLAQAFGGQASGNGVPDGARRNGRAGAVEVLGSRDYL
jgi:hypothetical protein